MKPASRSKRVSMRSLACGSLFCAFVNHAVRTRASLKGATPTPQPIRRRGRSIEGTPTPRLITRSGRTIEEIPSDEDSESESDEAQLIVTPESSTDLMMNVTPQIRKLMEGIAKSSSSHNSKPATQGHEI